MTTEAWPPPPVAVAAATTTTMPIAGRCLARVLLRAAGGAIECSRLRCIDVDIDETVAVFFTWLFMASAQAQIQGGPKKLREIFLAITLVNMDRF